jgi:hypothetical protein
VKDVIHRIPRKAIPHLSQQLALCIGPHNILRQNNEGSRSSDQPCRPIAVFSAESSGTLRNTGLTNGVHCYVNGIVNKHNRRTWGAQNPNFHKAHQPNRPHSWACFVYCWYSGSNMQKRQEESEPTNKPARFNPVKYTKKGPRMCQTQNLLITNPVEAKRLGSYEAVHRLYNTV